MLKAKTQAMGQNRGQRLKHEVTGNDPLSLSISKQVLFVIHIMTVCVIPPAKVSRFNPLHIDFSHSHFKGFIN